MCTLPPIPPPAPRGRRAGPRWASPRSARALVLLGLLGLLGTACADGDEPRPPAGAPNVLLITLDTTRADRLGCYGYAPARTPRIDSLAADGARFGRAVATAGVTPMSHASILTGLNPYRHGLRVFAGGASNRIRDGVPTLASLLRARGWHTAAFVSAYTVQPAFGLDRGFDLFDTGLEQVDLSSKEPLRDARAGHWRDARAVPTQRRADATTEAARAWLEGRRDGEPWFLWVHYFDVHDFNVVPPAAFARERGIEYDPSVPRSDPVAREALYDLELEYLDLHVGDLLDDLGARGWRDDTVVVVTADHGQGLSDGEERHGWALHRLLYDWSVRVPLLVDVPGEQAGVVVEDLVRTIDVVPTVLEAAGLPPPPHLEGRSLLGLMRGQPDEPRTAYADALNTLDLHAPLNGLPEACRDDLFALVEERWKLVHHRHAPENDELYDLAADPLELHNVAAEHPAEVARMRAALAATGALDVPAAGAEDGGAEVDVEALEALGYVGDH